MKTTLAKHDAPKQWYVVDAEGQTLGRLAVKIANVLRGRHKVDYTPFLDTGDYVIVTNAEKVVLSGKKELKKYYMFYTGWRGNEYYRSVAHFREHKPEFLFTHAVKGMLPRNKLARHMLKKLRVYAGSEHPHEAQEPKPLPGTEK
ncbi:MAG: 50S ribosomal protein L13 [Opitutales bacterium]